MKVVIIGGVAAGASAAARLRRLDETAEIVLFERGEHISYANCGLPYHVGGVIQDREDLLVMSEEGFHKRFCVDVRTNCEVVSINREAKTVHVRRPGADYTESYDCLIIATGAEPILVPIEGLPPSKTFTLTTLADMDRLIAALKPSIRSVAVVGGGFIGVEAAENLAHRGLSVTLVERNLHLLSANFDAEMAPWLERSLEQASVTLALGHSVNSWQDGVATLDNGAPVPADIVLMCIGVRPRSTLAREAGLELGPRGHIIVDENLRTSDPLIYAAGDVCEGKDPLTGRPSAIALAGPANRQGRAVASNIIGRPQRLHGTFGASVVKVGTWTGASIGLTELRARAAGLNYRAIYAHPFDHASYYPDSHPLHLKLLIDENFRILGAQAIGQAGVEKRIDVIATAMRFGATACDLADLELCYAPPYGSAKDPVNILGMIASNLRDGLTSPITLEALPQNAFLLDVREPSEFAFGAFPNAVNIPLGTLRDHLTELPCNRPIVVYCKVGQRGYFAERILRQNGFDKVYNLSGGFTSWHP